MRSWTCRSSAGRRTAPSSALKLHNQRRRVEPLRLGAPRLARRNQHGRGQRAGADQLTHMQRLSPRRRANRGRQLAETERGVAKNVLSTSLFHKIVVLEQLQLELAELRRKRLHICRRHHRRLAEDEAGVKPVRGDEILRLELPLGKRTIDNLIAE